MGVRLFNYQHESDVQNYILEHTEREVIERQIIESFVKDLPLSVLKQVFNFETIDKAYCLRKIEKAQNKGESLYWTSEYHRRVHFQSEKFLCKLTVKIDEIDEA